jgi:hypothetical protein
MSHGLPPAAGNTPPLEFYTGHYAGAFGTPAGQARLAEEVGKLVVDFPPESGGTRSERHAASSMVIPSMLALASAGVR